MKDLILFREVTCDRGVVVSAVIVTAIKALRRFKVKFYICLSCTVLVQPARLLTQVSQCRHIKHPHSDNTVVQTTPSFTTIAFIGYLRFLFLPLCIYPHQKVGKVFRKPWLPHRKYNLNAKIYNCTQNLTLLHVNTVIFKEYCIVSLYRKLSYRFSLSFTT